jgi:hypothetical protein
MTGFSPGKWAWLSLATTHPSFATSKPQSFMEHDDPGAAVAFNVDYLRKRWGHYSGGADRMVLGQVVDRLERFREGVSRPG